MTCPVEQNVDHWEFLCALLLGRLTSRNFPVPETNAIVASRTRSRSASDPQGPCTRLPFDLAGLQKSVMTDRPCSGPLSKPSWQHLGNG